MGKNSFRILLIVFFFLFSSFAHAQFAIDEFETSKGKLKITFIGHASLIFDFNGKIIYIDPFSDLADYSKLPKADIIFITHDHRDHLDIKALEKIRTGESKLILTEICAKQVKGGIIMKNGDVQIIDGINVKAVPAYNLIHKRDSGQFYHPKGDGNGYILTFGDKLFYVAGDTENIPEMKALKDIYCAFLPMNLPYTMTPEMVSDAVRSFRPKILYPYHYGDTDTSKLLNLLKDDKNVEVRIRNMK
ncbi:MAG: MBL fold metallo-hydrolase [bacterium]|nr:MBL fold metallo-hydrolase [bacterium]